MEEGRKHIDDLFREGLEGYREMPDAAVWTSIEQRLPRRGHRRPFLWLWILLMLALLSSLGYYANKYWNNEPLSSTETSTSHSPSLNEDAIVGEKNIQENELKNKNEGNERVDKATNDTTEKTETSLKNSRHFSLMKMESVKVKNTTVSDENVKDETVRTQHTTAKENADKTEGTQNDHSGNAIIGNKEKQDGVATKEVNNPSSTETKGQKNSIQQNLPGPNKEIINNKNAVAANTDKKSVTSPPSLQEESKKQKPVSDEKTNSSTRQNLPDPNKEIANNTKTTTNRNENTQSPVTEPSERAKGISFTGTDAEKGKPQPITVPAEPAKGKPMETESERAKGVPVNVSPEPNAEKPPINVNAANVQKKPLYIEPAKEYGIKINQEMEDDADDNKGSEGETPSGGGGSTAKDKRKKDNRFKLDGGVKLGHDRGFSDITTSNFTGNLFLQWNISPRTSLVFQPGIRYHSINKTSVFPQSSFHDITAQSLDSAHVYSDSANIQNYYIQRNFIYQNSYDSITVSYSLTPQKYLEVELPLLLQYKLADNISILGGIQLAFGQVVQIQSSMQRYQGSRIDTLDFPQVKNTNTPDTNGNSGAPYPDVPALNGYFSYSTPEISTLDENKYRNPITNPARFGAMLGFSYEYRRRLLIDLLVRKNLSDLSFIPNEEVRKIYSQPYFRITVGYKLFQSK